MDKTNRPKGREKNVTGQGAGVHRRGEGTGSGPVGSGSNIFSRPSTGAKPGGSGQSSKPAGGSGKTPRPGMGTGSSQRPSGGFIPNPGMGTGMSGGETRQTRGRLPLPLLLLAAIILLGGGGGLGSCLGLGGGNGTSAPSLTGSSGTGSYGNTTSQTVSGNSSGTAGSNAGSVNSSSGTASSTSGNTGSTASSSTTAQSGGSSLSDYISLLTGGTGSSSSSGWGSGGNTGVLNRKVSDKARDKYTTIRGNGRDVVTIMVYMCGTDLESRSGMATRDLSEMAKAKLSDNINLIIYTGGCSRWQNNIISSRVNEIYQVKDGGLVRLSDNAGSSAMTSPDTLTSFITWGAQNFPADRYDLIFWDHGGGSLSGYGYDEKNARSGSMSLAQIDSALSKAGQKFDFIGFDACLMATVETARMLSSYADYLIASEETEPGIGWYYTNWLTDFSANTSMPTLDVGQRIVDDFVDTCARQCRGQSATLSVVDLAELQETLPSVMSSFSQDLLGKIRGGEYKSVSQARNSVREFAQSSVIDQIDFVDFLNKVNSLQAQSLANVLLDAVKYNRSSLTNAYGLSVYFPYKKMSSVNTAVQTYNALDMDDDFTSCIREFASLELGGQASSGMSGTALESLFGGLFGSSLSGSSSYGSSSQSGSYGGAVSSSEIADLLSALMGGSSYGGSSYGNSSYGNSSYGNSSYGGSMAESLLSGLASLAGVDTGFFGGRAIESGDAAEYLAANQFDPSQLFWKQNADGENVISLTDDQWDLITDVAINIFYDDGEGYVDLGVDNTGDSYSFDDEGNLVPNLDKTWISLNGQPVCYYWLDTIEEEDGSYRTYGKVPAMLNGDRVNLILVFDTENPKGYIAGAQPDYDAETTETVARGLIDLQAGDKIDFLCDFFSYDGEFQDSYYLGEQMVVGEDEIEISDTFLGDDGTLVLYQFTDIYQQHYWTEILRG
ncbi:MAG: peptidase C11 [Blautia sp.]|nr:peptidase C11 [Blautia sp.]